MSSDADLEALRAKRLAELQQQYGGANEGRGRAEVILVSYV